MQARPYGVLLPGERQRIPVVVASTVDIQQYVTSTSPFFDNIVVGRSTGGCARAPCVGVTVPVSAGPDCDSARQMEDSYTVYMQTTDMIVTNAWLQKSTRADEPSGTHIRDHIWNVNIRALVKQHMNTQGRSQLMLERDPEFSYEMDYLWRLPRVLGDIRKVPEFSVEVIGMHLRSGPDTNPEDDVISLRINTAEGPVIAHINSPEESLPMDQLCLEPSLNSFYGQDKTRTSVLNRLCLTTVIYALMDAHGMSRRAVFELLNVKFDDLIPIHNEGKFYTWDNFKRIPADQEGHPPYWDRKAYRLYGEYLYDGTASESDKAKFREYAAGTADLLDDIRALISLPKMPEILKTVWWHGISMDPNWGSSLRMCINLAEYMAKQEGSGWTKTNLAHQQKDVYSTDWGFEWSPYTLYRNNKTDYEFLVRLGIVPFYPRLAFDNYASRMNWKHLASYYRKVTPVCAVIWDKMENQTRELKELSQVLGEAVDPQELKKQLEPAVIRSGRPFSAVFVLGVMEFLPIKKATVEKNLREFQAGLVAID